MVNGGLIGLVRKDELVPLRGEICFGDVDVIGCRASKRRLDSLQERIEIGKSLAERLFRQSCPVLSSIIFFLKDLITS